MTRFRTTALSLVFLGALAIGSAGTYAYAQQPQPAPGAQSGASSDPQKWTRKDWKKMQAQWKKDNPQKFSDCQKQLKPQKLRGRKYWDAMNTCMTGAT